MGCFYGILALKVCDAIWNMYLIILAMQSYALAMQNKIANKKSR